VDAVEMHDAAEDVADVEEADAAGVDVADVGLHGVDEDAAVGGAVDVAAAAVAAAAVVAVVDAAAAADVDVVDDVADGVVAVDDAVFVAVEVGKLENSVAVSHTAILAVVEKTPHCCNYHIVDLLKQYAECCRKLLIAPAAIEQPGNHPE